MRLPIADHLTWRERPPWPRAWRHPGQISWSLTPRFIQSRSSHGLSLLARSKERCAIESSANHCRVVAFKRRNWRLSHHDRRTKPHAIHAFEGEHLAQSPVPPPCSPARRWGSVRKAVSHQQADGVLVTLIEVRKWSIVNVRDVSIRRAF